MTAHELSELWPASISLNDVPFALGSGAPGAKNILIPAGQTLAIPAGSFNRVYVLAASANNDQRATFRAGDHATDVTIQNWTGYVGQWDNRVWRVRDESARD